MKQLLYALLFAATSAAADVVIEEPWAPATPPATTVAAGYLAITNTESTPDHLIGATSPVAERVEMHVSFTENGIAKMRQQAGLVVPGKARLELKRGAGHLMFVGLKQPFKQGETVPLTLYFERAGQIRTALHVQKMGAREHAH